MYIVLRMFSVKTEFLRTVCGRAFRREGAATFLANVLCVKSKLWTAGVYFLEFSNLFLQISTKTENTV
jgi:hypothetical protein